MKQKSLTAVLCVAAVAFGLLWLTELSQRLARQKADRFMGPLLTVYTCTNMRLTPWFTDADGQVRGPTWWALYDSHLFLVDFPPEVGVSVFGAVTAAHSVGNTNDWVSLPEEERHRQQWLWVKAFHDFQDEREPNQALHGTAGNRADAAPSVP